MPHDEDSGVGAVLGSEPELKLVDVPESHPAGLREDKKRRTRERIRLCALALFEQRGYRETPMDQIAAAADVAPRTLYRYFPTKESLVITDEDDEPLLEHFAAELDQHDPIEAVRLAVRATVLQAETGDDRLRRRLIEAEPELQAALVRTVIAAAERYADAIAKHPKHDMSYSEALTLTGAITGIALTVQHWDNSTNKIDQLAEFDTSLARLARGLGAAPASGH